MVHYTITFSSPFNDGCLMPESLVGFNSILAWLVHGPVYICQADYVPGRFPSQLSYFVSGLVARNYTFRAITEQRPEHVGWQLITPSVRRFPNFNRAQKIGIPILDPIWSSRHRTPKFKQTLQEVPMLFWLIISFDEL